MSGEIKTGEHGTNAIEQAETRKVILIEKEGQIKK
jgi:hypothetical protein